MQQVSSIKNSILQEDRCLGSLGQAQQGGDSQPHPATALARGTALPTVSSCGGELCNLSTRDKLADTVQCALATVTTACSLFIKTHSFGGEMENPDYVRGTQLKQSTSTSIKPTHH